jgi:hypothetical protein
MVFPFLMVFGFITQPFTMIRLFTELLRHYLGVRRIFLRRFLNFQISRRVLGYRHFNNFIIHITVRAAGVTQRSRRETENEIAGGRVGLICIGLYVVAALAPGVERGGVDDE